MKKLLRFVIISLVSINLLFLLFKPEKKKYDTGYTSSACREYSKTLVDTALNITLKEHQRSWLDYDHINGCLKFRVNKAEKDRSRNLYQNLYSPTRQRTLSNYHKFYGEIYYSLYQQDKEKLKFLADSFATVGTIRNLNRNQLAELIVTFVQDIPYSYVFSSTPCTTEQTDKSPCSSGNKYGLLTPLDFMYTLIGDCDTRSLLLYLLLKQLNYDIAIVISYEYAHAMIAINLPYAGDFITHNKKKYYFWETTGMGWEPGILPPDCKNTNYWKVSIY